MNKKIITIILLLFTACAYANALDPTSEAQALFDAGQFSQGRDVLNKSLGNDALTTLQRAQVIKTLAQFYEKLVGDTRIALRFYKRILKTDLPNEHTMKAFAKTEISRLNEIEKKYAEQNAYLKKLRVSASRKQNVDDAKEQISKLFVIAENNPQYYRLAEVYYYVGASYMTTKEYKQAVTFLNKAQEVKPAINFFLPVTGKVKYAQDKWIRGVANRFSWGTIGILLIVTALSFYASKPWQWLQLRHLTIGLTVVILWSVVFLLAHLALSSGFRSSDEVALQIGAEIPAFMGAKLASPGSRIVGHLFSYALVAVLGTFIFALATSRLKCKCSASILNAIFGLLICSALITVFYLRICDHKSVLNSQTEGITHYPKASLYFRQYDLEPYILTNPKAYPNLNLGNIPDRHLLKWVVKHGDYPKPEEKHKH